MESTGEQAGPGSRVAVVGLGTVGAELAAALCVAGVPVTGIEIGPDEAAAGEARVREHCAAARAGEALARFTVHTGLDAAAGCAVVVEAVPEDLTTKREVLASLAAVADPGAVAVVTALALPLDDVVANTGWHDRACGIRYLGPLATVRLVELVRSAEAEPAAERVAEMLGTLGVRARTTQADRQISVPVALLMRTLNAAALMHDHGYASAADIDTAMRLGCGWHAGPLELLDRIGLDCALDVLTVLASGTGREAFAPAPGIRRLVSAGRLGTKSGAGFHPAPSTAGLAEVSRAEAASTVRRIGVIGSGTMATGIAAAALRAGVPAVLVARTADRAATAVVAAYEQAGDGCPDVLTGSDTLAALADCDVVIEAVVEDLAVKRAVLAEADRVGRPGAVLATTTSSLPVIDCATATTRPQDVLGLHFFNPVPAMRLVELVPTVLTGADCVRTGAAVCELLDKDVVTCVDRAGFIVNRLLFPMINDALLAVRRGDIGCDAVDALVRSAMGLPMGPVRLLDMVGADVALSVQESLWREFGSADLEPAPVLAELVGSGHLGRKSGASVRTHPSLRRPMVHA